MKRRSNAVFFCSLAGMVVLAACGGSEHEATGAEGDVGTVEGAPVVREPSPEAVRAAESLTARLATSDVTLVATQRGNAQIGYTQPRATRERNFIVTTFLIQNQSANALAGFQVDEFWFDADGNTVTGDRVRFREPILPQEVVAIELRVPRNPAMDRSNYEFTHQNGEIEPTLVEELPEPEPEEEEGEEGEDEPRA